jgi:hypothetical protein
MGGLLHDALVAPALDESPDSDERIDLADEEDGQLRDT